MRPSIAGLLLSICSIVGSVSAAGCDKNGPRTRTPRGPLAFGTSAAAVGDREGTEYTVKLDLTYEVPFEGEQHHSFLRSAQYDSEVLEVRRGLPTAVRVAYRSGREAMIDEYGVDDDETRVGGNRYLVRYEKRDIDIEKESRGKHHASEKMQLAVDFTRFGGPGALRAQLRGKQLEVGDRVDLSPGEVMDRFAEPHWGSPSQTADVTSRMLSLELTGVRERCGRAVAVFDAAMSLTSEFSDGLATAALTGRAEFDVETARPVSIQLRGPVAVAPERGAQDIGEGSASFDARFTEPDCD